MQATCARCGSSHTANREGPAVPCPQCGYTALVVSASPPSFADLGEPTRWGAALAGCVAISTLVMVCALTLTRLAERLDRELPALPGQQPCESCEPVCVDPSLWAAQGQD